MPREVEPSRFRRLMMQWIMWVILGITVAGAAAVNQFKRQALKPVLREQVELRGVSVRMPTGWIGREDEGDGGPIVRQSQMGMLIFTVRARTLTEMFQLLQQGPGERPTFVQEIDLGGTPARLMLQRIAGRSGNITALEVSRNLPQARVLSISMLIPNTGEVSELAAEIDLIKRVAESVQVDANY